MMDTARPLADSDEMTTLSVPDAGREFFDLSLKPAYQAARRGEIPVIRVGNLLKVPRLAVRAMFIELGRLAAERADKRNQPEQVDAA